MTVPYLTMEETLNAYTFYYYWLPNDHLKPGIIRNL